MKKIIFYFFLFIVPTIAYGQQLGETVYVNEQNATYHTRTTCTKLGKTYVDVEYAPERVYGMKYHKY